MVGSKNGRQTGVMGRLEGGEESEGPGEPRVPDCAINGEATAAYLWAGGIEGEAQGTAGIRNITRSVGLHRMGRRYKRGGTADRGADSRMGGIRNITRGNKVGLYRIG